MMQIKCIEVSWFCYLSKMGGRDDMALLDIPGGIVF